LKNSNHPAQKKGHVDYTLAIDSIQSAKASLAVIRTELDDASQKSNQPPPIKTNQHLLLSFHLPRLKIPTFSGDILEYSQFVTSFQIT